MKLLPALKTAFTYAATLLFALLLAILPVPVSLTFSIAVLGCMFVWVTAGVYEYFSRKK